MSKIGKYSDFLRRYGKWVKFICVFTSGFILNSVNIGYATELENQYKSSGGKPMTFSLTSPMFSQNEPIPVRATCDGEDISPPLAWSGVPSGTKSLALVVDDPDAPDPAAPKMTWVHWVLYNIPPDINGLREGITSNQLPEGTKEGLNDWHRTGYGGPCPPIGRHRYVHKLYALDTLLSDLGSPAKTKLEAAMKGHIIGKAELIGTYQRNK